MLRIFRRLLGPARSPSEPSGRMRASAPAAPPVVSEPIPVPEVVEGNGGESDWNLWQDSVLTLDTQIQELTPARSHEKTQPLSSEELKAYASARKGEAS